MPALFSAPNCSQAVVWERSHGASPPVQRCAMPSRPTNSLLSIRATGSSSRIPGSLAPAAVANYLALGKDNIMRDLGWLIVAVVAGVLAAVGWIARERWIMRRRRR
jgi:hypothetical protein